MSVKGKSNNINMIHKRRTIYINMRIYGFHEIEERESKESTKDII